MRAAPLLLLFLASCAPLPPAAHPRPASNVVAVVFYHTAVHQQVVLDGLADMYRGFDVDFDFAYDLGPKFTLIVTDEPPEAWKVTEPTAVGAAPLNCHGAAGGVALSFYCSRDEDTCYRSGAHEIGHVMIGLEHVVGDTDLMGTQYKPGAHFTDQELPTLLGICRGRQNSISMLRAVLGSAPDRLP